MKGRVLIISIFLQMFVGAPGVQAENDNRAAIFTYVDEFSEIAVSEMHRTGIPASVKLAQAILESNAGRSHLARSANNHFGIKCGSSWEGGKAWRKDDDYDRNGKLRHSCFRAYEHAQASFIAHSDFLADPNKAHRYGFLFELDPTDYKAWARGLKKAGYATNPKYAHLLISIVESYDLHKYDFYEALPDEEELLAQAEARNAPVPEEKETRQIFFMIQGGDSYKIHERNKVEYVRADEGDTPEYIALELGISLEELLDYNDHIYDGDEELAEGDPVFIEKKKNRFKRDRDYHTVAEGESMEDIAQSYAIKLEKLYKRNRMKEGTQPRAGERVILKGRRSKNSTVRLRPAPELRAATDLETPGREVPPPSSNKVEKEEAVINRRADTPDPPEVPQLLIHVVQKGETLYAISRKYGLTLEELRRLNEIEDDLIVPGQEVVVSRQ